MSLKEMTYAEWGAAFLDDEFLSFSKQTKLLLTTRSDSQEVEPNEEAVSSTITSTRFEHVIGLLWYASNSLHPRIELGRPEVDFVSDDVPNEVLSLFQSPFCSEPVFLRIAINALAERARFQEFIKAEGERSSWHIWPLLLVVSGCVSLALWVASEALGYRALWVVPAVAFGFLYFFANLKDINLKRLKRRFHLTALKNWDYFITQNQVGWTGVGAYEMLSHFQGIGIQVPSLAFDLCIRLQDATRSCEHEV